MIQIIHFFSSVAHNFFYQSRIYFLWFVIYGFIGWFYETTICSQVKYHKFINRGYLKGPICPIYGAGAVLNYLLLGKIGSTPGIFVAAMFVSGVVEYLTSYVMERAFHQRWWDYTRYRFNLHGRICLYGCVIFGAANVVMLKAFHPVIMTMTAQIPDRKLTQVTIFLYLLFLIDVIYTTVHMETVNERIHNWSVRLEQKRVYLLEKKAEYHLIRFRKEDCRELVARIRERMGR